MQKDPDKRASLEDLLNDEWFGFDSPIKSSRININAISRLKRFKNDIEFKNLALTVLVTYCNDKDIKNLMKLFKKIDSNNSGRIELKELKNVLKNISNDEIQNIYENVDFNHSGAIN